jgi:hypothetical protein
MWRVAERKVNLPLLLLAPQGGTGMGTQGAHRKEALGELDAAQSCKSL